jgi:hypothetical protein
VVVGLFLLPPNALWVLYMESIGARGPWVSTYSILLNVIFILLVVALANRWMKAVRPGLALTQGELIVTYVMLTTCTAIVGHDMLQVLLSLIPTGYWFATPQNSWEQILDTSTPSWLLVSDREVLYGYWNGMSTLYQPSVLKAWAAPILWWSAFMLALVFVLLCLSVILRPLWGDRERLTFPITHLPLELSDPNTRLFKSKVLWVGLLVAGGIDVVNGLGYLYPPMTPLVQMYVDLGPSITAVPWSGIGWLPITFYPSMIGLSFLMPLDLLFSCVFFFFWWKALYVIAAATGVSSGYGSGGDTLVFPYVNEQMFGGFIAIALSSLLIGRRYFWHVLRRAFGRSSEIDDSREGMGLRWALLGALIGLGILIALSLRCGMSPHMAAAFFLIYCVLALAVARVRAEFGSPVHDFHFTGPDYILPRVLGTVNLRQRDMGMLAQYFWFNRAYRAHPIAGSLEGLQMANRRRTSARAVLVAIVIAVAASALAGFWGWLHLAYKYGASSLWRFGPNWFGSEAYARLQSWVEAPKPANLAALGAMAAGFAICMLLATARSAFVGWPLNPVALPLAASWSIHLMWLPMFIAWLVKLLVLRYGGRRLYQAALPLFLGLIMGQAIVGSAWTFVGLLKGHPYYNVLTFGW